MDVRVRLFGGVRVEGVAPADLGTRKARTVLAVLAAEGGRAVAADRLAAAVWTGALPSRPGDQLGVLVSRLRRVLGPGRIVRTSGGYALAADWSDLAEFGHQAEAADAALAAGRPGRALARARAALALATDEVLAGETGEWADGVRRGVRRRGARLRVVLAEAAVLVGEPWRAVAAAEEVLDDDPYDEAALRALMRAHVATGRPAQALAAFAGLRARLADDLGADPDPATAALHTQVLRGEVVVRPEPALVGRTVELALLDQRLADVTAGAARVVAVRGEPGIGKTAVLEAFVAAVRSSACVLHGRCDALGRELPLQPLLDGVELLLRESAPGVVVAALGDDAVAVEALLGRTHPVSPPAVPVPADPGHEQARLFAALLRVLRRVAGQSPLVIAIDDLHLAGPSTLAWLRFAARRGGRVLVVVTTASGPLDVPDRTEHLDLGPLDVAAAEQLVGAEHGRAMWERSGGNPLLLLALAAGRDGGALPGTVRDAIEPVLAGLGAAGATLRAAAVVGPEVDPQLLAAVLEIPVPRVLDDLDAALRLRLLVDRGGELRFTHELVREAVAAGASPARRAFLHRRAAAVLAAGAGHDPLTVAWHARCGGDAGLACTELVRAARTAVQRGDLQAATALLDDAARLDRPADLHLARTDVLLRCGDLDGARHAADAAIAAGAGTAGYELAGWTAYYQRDHARALRFAAMGASRAGDAAARAACAALAGRARHSVGELAAAQDALTRAVSTAPAGRDGLPRVWLAALRAHQGRPAEALELTEEALLDPAALRRHPFAAGQGHFARVYALGMLGRPVDALAALDALERSRDADSPAVRRIRGVLRNMRGWLLRGVGELGAADAQHAAALAGDEFPGPEPHAHAGLDLVESALLAGDAAEARVRLAAARLEQPGTGTMVWHQRERHGLLTARIALLERRFPDAALAAAGVLTSTVRGSARHELAARVLLGCARAAAGEAVDPDELEAALDALAEVAGLEAWRYTALAARHLAVRRWEERAGDQVTALAARAGDHGDGLLRFAAGWVPAPTA